MADLSAITFPPTTGLARATNGTAGSARDNAEVLRGIEKKLLTGEWAWGRISIVVRDGLIRLVELETTYLPGSGGVLEVQMR